MFDLTTQTGSALYMSPETHLGQPYNEKTDVFSFGMVLYELMARSVLAMSEVSHLQGECDAAAVKRCARCPKP